MNSRLVDGGSRRRRVGSCRVTTLTSTLEVRAEERGGKKRGKGEEREREFKSLRYTNTFLERLLLRSPKRGNEAELGHHDNQVSSTRS